MEQYFTFLQNNPLFAGIDQQEMESLLHCLGARIVLARKGAPVFLEGDQAGFVGLVLSGAVQIVRDDFCGNRSILAVAEEGELFGEAFSCAGVEWMPVSGYALQDSRILWLECRKMLTVCSSACRFHNQLVKNLLRIVAQRNLYQNRKIQFMSQKTTQDKLMAYLLDQAKQKNSAEFTIPLERQALADFLGVERSAMSAELSKLRKNGVLECKGSWFRLLVEKNKQF